MTSLPLPKRKTPPGETRYWCSCDDQTLYLSSAELLRHITRERAREAARDDSAAR